MRPLTDRTPKPLLEVGGKPLIAWQVERLVAGGFTELVINHAWLGEQLEHALGDGSRFGARIAWSREATALETAGGIATALPLLEAGARDRPFAVVSADIYTRFDYARLVPVVESIDARFPLRAAHLVTTPNPDFHPRGDFAIEDGLVRRDGDALVTYGNIGVFHPRLFDGVAPGTVLALFPWLYSFADEGRVTGEFFSGPWHNLGTPEQLAALDRSL